MTHYLKTWPEYFKAIRQGYKTFEIRRNDRDYKKGDILILHEWDPKTESYTGRIEIVEVIYTMTGPEEFGLSPGFVCMSIKIME